MSAFASKTRGMMMSQRMDWETPDSVFAPLQREFGLSLDVCATSANSKCIAFFSPEEDGLFQTWTGACWMNPPYGREIGRWIAKASASAAAGATVVCLLPARVDTAWWHDHIEGKAEVRFIRGRVKFVGAQHTAPFPCAVVIFRPRVEIKEKRR